MRRRASSSRCSAAVAVGGLLLVACTPNAGVESTGAEPLDTRSAPTTTTSPTTTSAPPDDGAPIPPLDTDVSMFTLDNGLRVYLRNNNRPGSNAEMRLAVNAGSGLEQADQSGVAHFLEHMLFNGTEKYPKNELIATLREFGMEFGADINAYTSYDETVYELSVPLRNPDNLGKGVEILAQWLDAATIDPAQVAAERGVVLDEYRVREETQEGRAYLVLADMFLKGSAYEGRAPIGTAQAIETMEQEPLQRFYDTWYRPDNAAVVIVGDFNVDDAEREVRNYFESITAEGDLPQATDFSVGPFTEPRVGLAPDPDAVGVDVELTLPLPAVARREQTSSDLTNELLTDMAFEMIANRLVGDISDGTTALQAAYVSSNDSVRTIDSPSIVVSGNDEQIDLAVETLVTEFERVARFGFDDNELARVVAAYESSVQGQFDSRDTVHDSEYAERYVAHFLTGTRFASAQDEYELAIALLDGVTADAVQAEFVARYNAVGAHLFLNYPDSVADAPTETAVLATVDAIRNDDSIEAREESNPVATQLMTAPEPVDEVSSAQGASEPTLFIDATRLEFANGVTVLINPNDIADDAFVFTADSEGGTSLVADADVADALVATDVIRSSGLGELSQSEVDTVLDGSTIEHYLGLEPEREWFEGAASGRDLELMFQLFHQYIEAPRVNEVALQNTIDYYADIADDPLSNPDWAPWVALAEARYGDERRYAVLPTAAELDSVDAAGIERVWQQRFGERGDWVIVVAGDVSVADVTDLARRYVGTLTLEPSVETVVDVRPDPPATKVERTVNAGSGDTGSLIRQYSGTTDGNTNDAIMADLLTSVLDARLTDHIREELGASYSPYARITIERSPDLVIDSFLEVSGDPTGIAELSTVLDADLIDVATNGPTADEFDTAVAALDQKYQYVNNRTISEVLTREERSAGPVADYVAQYETLFTITPDELKAFAARALPPGRFIEVRNLPE